jgi:hypothetical protein
MFTRLAPAPFAGDDKSKRGPLLKQEAGTQIVLIVHVDLIVCRLHRRHSSATNGSGASERA